MRRLVVAVAIVCAALVGCGESREERAARELRDALAELGPEEREPVQRAAELGEPLRLVGYTGGLDLVELEVTVTRIIEGVPADEFTEPSGSLVGVELRIENVGDRGFNGPPRDAVMLVTARGEQAEPSFDAGGRCGAGFADDLRLPPGDERVGCIPFELQEGQRPERVQVSFDEFGVGGADTGVWWIP